MSKGRKAAQAAVGQKRPEAAHSAVGQERLRAACVAVGLTLSKATQNFIFFAFLFRFLFSCFGSFRFHFASVSLRVSMFHLDANEAKENLFFVLKRKKISLLFGFVWLLFDHQYRRSFEDT